MLLDYTAKGGNAIRCSKSMPPTILEAAYVGASLSFPRWRTATVILTNPPSVMEPPPCVAVRRCQMVSWGN